MKRNTEKVLSILTYPFPQLKGLCSMYGLETLLYRNRQPADCEAGLHITEDNTFQ